MMKKTLILLSLLLYLSVAMAQIQIVSGTDWGLSNSQTGPFNQTIYEVTNCVDEAYIDAQCGAGYGSPMLNTHFAGCPGMRPIWGIPPPGDCYYPPSPGNYWFQKIFSLCSAPSNAQVKIQADQKFTLYINGTLVGSTGDSDWNILQTYDVTSLVTAGNNTILVRADNINGGSCFNYAFLAFCMDITSVNPFVVTPMQDRSACSGQSVSLQASAGGTAYSWSPAAGLSATNIANPIASPTATTTYTVTITDPCGLNHTDDVVVTVLPSPNAVASNDGPFCPGDPVQLSANGGNTYIWSGPAGFSSTQQNPSIPAFSSNLAGTYTAIVTGANGCTSTATTSVQSLPTPNVSITSPSLFCLVSPPLQLMASPAGGVWGGVAPPSGLLNPAAIGLGVHNLTYSYSSPGSCPVTVSQPIEIVAIIDAVIQDAGPFCLSSPLQTLIANPPGGVWSGDINPLGEFEPEVLGLGQYEVIYTYNSSQGCADADTITVEVVNSPLVVTLGNDLQISLGETLTLDALTNFPATDLAYTLWQPNDTLLNCPDCLVLPVRPLETTLYSVLVADQNGCEAIDYISVRVDATRSVYVPNIFSPNDDGVNDVLQLFADPLKVQEVQSFTVFGRWGEMVYQAKNFAPNASPALSGWNGRHRGQPVNPGTYVWIAEVLFVDNKSLVFSGDVSVIR